MPLQSLGNRLPVACGPCAMPTCSHELRIRHRNVGKFDLLDQTYRPVMSTISLITAEVRTAVWRRTAGTLHGANVRSGLIATFHRAGRLLWVMRFAGATCQR